MKKKFNDNKNLQIKLIEATFKAILKLPTKELIYVRSLIDDELKGRDSNV